MNDSNYDDLDNVQKPLTVKDFDVDDQPRERYQRYGVQALSNSELISIILRVGRRGRPITVIARELMNSCDNKFLKLEQRLAANEIALDGIGPVKLMELNTIMEIMKRYAKERLGDRPQILCSNDIYNYFRYKNANLPHEEMWALYLDNSNKVLGDMKISEGSAVGTIFDTKKVLKKAILLNAQGVVLCHNHPSGTLRPSGQDQMITDKFKKACETFEFRFLDHVIVSTEGMYSFHDNGNM